MKRTNRFCFFMFGWDSTAIYVTALQPIKLVKWLCRSYWPLVNDWIEWNDLFGFYCELQMLTTGKMAANMLEMRSLWCPTFVPLSSRGAFSKWRTARLGVCFDVARRYRWFVNAFPAAMRQLLTCKIGNNGNRNVLYEPVFYFICISILHGSNYGDKK